MGEYQIKRSGNKKLLEKLTALYGKNLCYNIECDVNAVECGYVVKSTIKAAGKVYSSVVGTNDVSKIGDAYLDALYQTLMISGLFTSNSCMGDKNTKNSCKDESAIDQIPETELQHIVIDHVTRLGKDFKKVFENYRVSDPCMLTPAICKKYLKAEVRKGVEVSIS
ncbi:MAG: hypothetical protein MJZ37_08165 [Bacilli bacterium]|nr:hypothetical protein [Bacilli bacterium]